jgi:hypothetical protein
MDRFITVEPGQCLEDIALQEYGSIDGVTMLVRDNMDVFVDGYSTDLTPGIVLRITEGALDAPMFNTLSKLGIRPSTNSIDTFVPPTGGDFNNDYNDDHNIS